MTPEGEDNATSLQRRLPIRFQARHIAYSAIASLEDDPATPSARLLDIAIEAISAARSIDLKTLSKRMTSPPFYPEVWPGEHYRLLAALIKVVRPRVVLEIGTATGLSALAMLSRLHENGRIVTFDIQPWQSIHEQCLTAQDFSDGRLIQVVADLGIDSEFEAYRDIIEQAEMIFVDGPKDGIFEARFIQHLNTARFAAPPLIVFDDTRVWNMLHIWRGISKPKLDVTSFGHWSGTGFVDWS